jgi:anti-anti-sigma regulatory factor
VIKFEVDQPKNLLTIRYAGAVEPAEVESRLEGMRSNLAQLQSGFRLLVDLTELQSMEVACAPFIEKAMDLCNEKGACLIVRVIPDPHRDIGLKIMSIFHYDSDVQILNCQTLEQAEEILRTE